MSFRVPLLVFCLTVCLPSLSASAQDASPIRALLEEQKTRDTSIDSVDRMRDSQSDAIKNQKAAWGHWGHLPNRYSTWVNHSNRLIPMYTFGITLDSLREEDSIYADAKRLETLYGSIPSHTLDPSATHFDQTDVYRLQKMAADAGKQQIIVMVFDGMDWPTTRAAAVYQSGRVGYDSGRGTGLLFQDYLGATTDFGEFVTSPRLDGSKFDVNSQVLLSGPKNATGGYDVNRGGRYPWREQSQRDYLIGLDRERPHTVTDSAASATSLFSGIKTYNGAINVAADGTQVLPIARTLQQKGYRIGVVSSVPVSHATPAATYANNVTRADYQDLARDLLGLASVSHRDESLRGVDVLIGSGWGEGTGKDNAQGDNFAQGNKYLHEQDLRRVDIKNGGSYVVAQRREGECGKDSILRAAKRAVDQDARFVGFYGTKGGHLPFQTADGQFNPTFDIKGTETYSEADIHENPTLADMTEAALTVLEKSPQGFWLMIEAGDVDWANHANNLDSSIGAVLSGDAAFKRVVEWTERNNAWDETAIIVTADHGHFLVIDDAEVIASAGRAE
ncbi:alkaline phosphatase [Novipirellula artificiosorum]|uniref:Alkaline phosphatase 4 n=1 Tax=Novipirellula artificiosorum TaxID=2528016 RepID=A0A5C6DVU3_9BACT|nr:alkaline phosphatase [Novipirellula artificiosorum]TWU40702.1 Alkaline phosphatase 4 precursor [Novipirellula artificiosorum]